jgi:hypothetical protein
VERSFKVTLSGEVDLVPADTPGPDAFTVAGMHCYVPGDTGNDSHFDVAGAVVTPVNPVLSTAVGVFENGDASGHMVTIAPNSTFTLACQILDDDYNWPAELKINQFKIEPCKTTGSPCEVYP